MMRSFYSTKVASHGLHALPKVWIKTFILLQHDERMTKMASCQQTRGLLMLWIVQMIVQYPMQYASKKTVEYCTEETFGLGH